MLRRYTETQQLWRSVEEKLWLSRWYITALVSLLLLTGVFLRLAVIPPTHSHKEVILTVPEGATYRQVADLLKGQELIRSRTAFILIVHLGYEGKPFVAGTYRLRRDMLLFSVLEKIMTGDVATARVTIPEGFTVDEIAARLDRLKVTNGKQFAKLAHDGARQFGYETATGSLEGYLFPATYEFHLRIPPQVVIQRMLDEFNARVIKPYGAAIRDHGKTLADVLTVASLIEREAKTDTDRPLIASVIENRLRAGMPLEIDATVLYAEGRHKGRVYYHDLELNSPYNTYKHTGLPPGPIANPGLKSITAALYPAHTAYLYYVASPDGHHLFARTFDEHRANIRKVRGL